MTPKQFITLSGIFVCLLIISSNSVFGVTPIVIETNDSSQSFRLSADSNFTTYIGSPHEDDATKVAFDNEGNTILIGQTVSDEMPTTTGVIQENYNGDWEPYIAKFSPTGDLIFCTYLGGDSYEHVTGVNTDSDNNIVLVGVTFSTNFPVTSDAYQSTLGGSGDGFITKLNPAGTEILYSTYFGGPGEDWVYGMELDDSDNYYFSGFAGSDGLATMGAYQVTRAGLHDAIVGKLSANGANLEFLSYFGGSGDEQAWFMKVDDSFNFAIGGITTSTNLPGVSGSYQEAHGGGFDGFLAKISSTGSSLVFSTYLGGSGEDMGVGISFDSQGNIITGGFTASTDFPVINALNDTYNGGQYDSIISKFNSSGSAIFVTYIGGSGIDRNWDVETDSEDNIYMIGRSASSDFPIINAPQPERAGNYDAVITKLAPDGQSILISTYFGGSDEDIGEGIAIDNEDHVVISGRTESEDFPVTVGAYQSENAGYRDSFVSHTALDAPIDDSLPSSTNSTTIDVPTEPGFPVESAMILIGVVVMSCAVILVIVCVRRKH